jgi:hypothetical protein
VADGAGAIGSPLEAGVANGGVDGTDEGVVVARTDGGVGSADVIRAR